MFGINLTGYQNIKQTNISMIIDIKTKIRIMRVLKRPFAMLKWVQKWIFDCLVMQKILSTPPNLKISQNLVFVTVENHQLSSKKINNNVEYQQLIKPIQKRSPEKLNISCYSTKDFITVRNSAKSFQEIISKTPKVIILSAFSPKTLNKMYLSEFQIKILKMKIPKTKMICISWDSTGKKYWKNALRNKNVDYFLTVDNPLIRDLDKKRIRYMA